MVYKVKVICPKHRIEIETNLKVKALNSIKISGGGKMIFQCPKGHPVEVKNQSEIIYEEE